MKSYLSIFFNLLIVSTLLSQNFHRLNVPVLENGVAYANPWAGGLNAPQWSKANLNNDGKPDLYAFDRNGGMHVPFLNIGGPGEAKYEFAPWLVQGWPQCGQFAYLRDFNHDGTPDLFTSSFIESGYTGIRVFKGKFQNGQLTFEKLTFPSFEEGDHLFFTLDGEQYRCNSENADLPAIDDIDGDGDMDILALISNGGNVNFYQNMAVEMGFSNDTLIYALGDDCWGKFYIQPFAQSLTLSCSPDLCAVDCLFHPGDGGGIDEGGPTAGPRHGGATLCTFDEDGDGDAEMVYGDLIYPNLIFGKNGGSSLNAWITDQDTIFPSYNTPVEINDFPSSFYLDFDNDGANDLLASSNLRSGGFDYEVGWFYKNNGSNTDHDFALQGKDIMVRDMLDFGSGAHPAFVDYNADGLMDLVVGNTNRWAPNFQDDPFLVLFENTGTPTEPAFEIVDRDWLNMSQFANIGVSPSYDFAPTFGDMDNDGDLDIIIGERQGTLYYGENTAGAGQPLSFGPLQPFWKNIFVIQYSTPAIHDMNDDGLPDLVIGDRNGTLTYFPNIGTASEPDFNPDLESAPNNRFFGEINTQNGGVTGYSSPVVLDFGTEKQIVTAQESGYLLYHRVNPDNLDSGPFELLDDKLGNLRDGHFTHIAFADLNGDEYLDAVVGNDRGGLGIFQSPITVDGLVDAKTIERPTLGINIFPNPAQDELTIEISTEKTPNGTFRIFSSLGQLSASGQIFSQKITVDLTGLRSGIYFIEIEMEGGSVVRKFVKN